MVSGTVRAENGLPLPGVVVRIGSDSRPGRETVSNSEGLYTLTGLEAGRYRLTATLQGFSALEATIDVFAGQTTTLDLRLRVAPLSEKVIVKAAAAGLQVTPSRAIVDRSEIERIPGALRARSLAAIVETTPSAVVTHDQVHVRGGHQIGYQIDGVPVPARTVGTNFALLFDPKDVEAIEFQRGAFPADYGDGAYGMSNVVIQSGFDRPRSAEAMLIAAGQQTYEGALAYGDHTDAVAYFGQLSANRTDVGLTPPGVSAIHNGAWGGGAAAKLWAPISPAQLVTVTGSARTDTFEIPRPPGNETRDSNQIERDGFLTLQWQHAGSGRTAWSVTPYYHYDRVALNAGAGAEAGASMDDRRIHYVGVRADYLVKSGAHEVKAGTNLYVGFLHDRFLLPVLSLPVVSEDQVSIEQKVDKAGVLGALYLEDRYRPSTGVTLNAGLRWDRSSAYLTESLLQPRVGLLASIPGTPLTAHAYAGRFFQAPPFQALGLGGAQFAFAGDQASLLVKAERDTQWETGLSFERAGTRIDVTYYETRARNFLDHEQLGASAVFFPVNVAEARLRGVEVSAAADLGKRVRTQLVYAYGFAEARGAVTGGLGDLEPRADAGYYFLDHDQRHTSTASLDWTMTARSWVHLAVRYGSGFLREDGPDHLPSHLTADVAVGLSGPSHWSAALEVENVTNQQYLINLSSEFNGTHVARPRSVGARLRFSF